jgi:hypothetical protein
MGVSFSILFSFTKVRSLIFANNVPQNSCFHTMGRTQVLENRMLRTIYGPKKREMAGNWRRLYNELHHLYT